MRGRKGQQEIVGFVLIVVMVMVAMMVFLIISVRDSGEEVSSVEVSNMLNVLMRTTSDCAIVYEPDYDDYEDLVKSCFKEDDCSNLNRSACDYLNESFYDIVYSISKGDNSIDSIAWAINLPDKTLGWRYGGCNGTVSGAQRIISSGRENLIVRMWICGT